MMYYRINLVSFNKNEFDFIFITACLLRQTRRSISRQRAEAFCKLAIPFMYISDIQTIKKSIDCYWCDTLIGHHFRENFIFIIEKRFCLDNFPTKSFSESYKRF